MLQNSYSTHATFLNHFLLNQGCPFFSIFPSAAQICSKPYQIELLLRDL